MQFCSWCGLFLLCGAVIDENGDYKKAGSAKQPLLSAEDVED
jgi:hypothetical protein